MSVVIHFTTDPFNSVLVLLFWIVPPLLFLMGVRFLGYNSADSTFNMNWIMVSDFVFCISVFVCIMHFEQISYYVGYLFSYFALFFALLVSPSSAFLRSFYFISDFSQVYTLDQIDAIHILTDTLKKPDFYYEVISEVLLTCVVLGDILSMCMSGAPLNSKSRFC